MWNYKPPAQARPYRVFSEIVNVTSIEKFMAMTGSRTMSLSGGQTLFEVLQSIRRRATPHGKGLGKITVVSWESESVAGFKGRRFTGCAGLDSVPKELEAEVAAGVPIAQCGVSVFAHSRLVKYICRDSLNLADIDAQNCVYNIYTKFYPEHTRYTSESYLKNREELLQLGMSAYGCTRDDIKGLFIRVGFAGSYDGWLCEKDFEKVPGQFTSTVEQIMDELRGLAEHLKATLPAAFAAVAGRKRPLASLLSVIFMHHERLFLEALEHDLPSVAKVMSLEHDGLVVQLTSKMDASVLVEKLRSTALLPIELKQYPSNVLEYVKSAYPHHAWTPSLIRLSIDEIAKCWAICRTALEEGPGACCRRNIAFAKVLATRLEGTVVIPTYNTAVVEEFDEVARCWRVSKKDKDEMHTIARGHMSMFHKVTYQNKHGMLKGVRSEDPVDPLMQTSFCNPVANEAILYLKVSVPPLDDAERVRHQILFSCGSLYCFKDGSVRRGMPEDRIRRHCPVPYRIPDLPADIMSDIHGDQGLIRLLHRFYKEGGRSLVNAAASAADPQHGLASQILVMLNRLVGVDRFIKFLATWTVDWDEVIIWLKWLARGASSHPRFTEATWVVGAAEGGKDMLVALLQSLFGTGDEGLVATLTYQYITESAGGWSNKESCAPFLRSCAAARFVLISEVPNESISMTTLKPLCEQRGALVASRGLYEGAGGFRPMALPLITSNFTPRLCANESTDAGAKSRIRVFSTPHIFSLSPSMASHSMADVTLGDAANAGELAPSMFFMLTVVYGLLDLSTDSRNVGPLPDRIAEETAQCFEDDVHSDSPFEVWLRTMVGPADTPAMASSTGDVYRSALEGVGGTQSATATQIRALLTQHGFHQDPTTRINSKRYYTRKFGDDEEAKPVRLL